MPYTLVNGQFHLFYQGQRHVGSRPDGDSLWFRPDDPGHLEGLGGRPVDYNGGGFAQLRLEGIDALELHFRGSNHQSTPECVDARDRLLQLAGFTDVTYAPSASCDIDTSVRTAAPHPVEGYILTRNADPYGRPVSFAVAGVTPHTDGDDAWLTPEWMGESLNARLIEGGHAYPAYYTGLPTDLRGRLTALASEAQAKSAGLWKTDVSMSGARVQKADDLERHALWPKLYRRLFAYFADGNKGLRDFEQWLRADADRDDELWIISRGELDNMHDIFNVAGNRLRMEVSPEDIVITPR
jgi:endonuclease YncB( thermonuclease family)